MLMASESEDQQDKVDDEQQYNRDFQDQHPSVGLVMIEQLIQIIERLKFSMDRPVPIGQVKPGRNILVNSRKVPIAEELRDIGQFIAEAGQVDPNLPQLAQNA